MFTFIKYLFKQMFIKIFFSVTKFLDISAKPFFRENE